MRQYEVLRLIMEQEPLLQNDTVVLVFCPEHFIVELSLSKFTSSTLLRRHIDIDTRHTYALECVQRSCCCLDLRPRYCSDDTLMWTLDMHTLFLKCNGALSPFFPSATELFLHGIKLKSKNSDVEPCP